MSRLFWAALIVVLVLGGWPLAFRPRAELLWRTPGAQSDGGSAGTPAALVVIAFERPAETEPADRFARAVAGVGPALC